MYGYWIVKEKWNFAMTKPYFNYLYPHVEYRLSQHINLPTEEKALLITNLLWIIQFWLPSIARFKDSAESETSRPSRIRLSPLRDESESRVYRLNSEETDYDENRSWLGWLGIMMIILYLIAIQCGNYISMYLWM